MEIIKQAKVIGNWYDYTNQTVNLKKPGQEHICTLFL